MNAKKPRFVKTCRWLILYVSGRGVRYSRATNRVASSAGWGAARWPFLVVVDRPQRPVGYDQNRHNERRHDLGGLPKSR